MSNTSRRELLGEVTKLVTGAAALPLVTLAQDKPGSEPEVTATEDLMREHGVIRRALLIYHFTAEKLRQSPSTVDSSALAKTAQLFRHFGEDYHERMLEEQHIFPIVKKMKGRPASYPDILIAQHNRGREITEYVLSVCRGPKIGSRAAELATVLDNFVLMYEHHAAREDTIVFPAWKKNFSNKQLDDLSEEFEQIEHKMFGRDGFDDAERTISGIEDTLHISDISQFTPAAPPKT